MFILLICAGCRRNGRVSYTQTQHARDVLPGPKRPDRARQPVCPQGSAYKGKLRMRKGEVS